MPTDDLHPADPATTSARALSGRLIDLAADLSRIDSTLADAIADHLDSIGLDNINNNISKAK